MKCRRIDLNVLACYRKGLKYIYPQNKEKWFNCVEERFNGCFHGRDLEFAIQFMEVLDQGASVWRLYEDLSHRSQMNIECFEKVIEIVAQFSKKGVEFYGWAMGNVLSRVMTCGQEKMLSRIARRNQAFENELQSENTIIDF